MPHTTRRIQSLGLLLAASLAVLGCSSDGAKSAASAAPTTTAPYRSDIYSKPANWLCRPDVRNDACDVDLTAALVRPDGSTALEPFTPAKRPAADCFYVYPTISGDKSANSDLTPGPEERNVVANQFARFGAVCRLYAPVYRQVPLAGIGFGGGVTTTTVAGARPPREIAYNDVRDAWKQYLANDNQGRPFVLVGHSQGAGHLTRLISEQIDGNPAVRRQLVSALLIGSGVPAPGTPGAFAHVPPCERTPGRAAVPTGCVISFATFLASEPPPEGSFFGQTRDGGRAICTNPATLSDATGGLQTYLPTPQDPNTRVRAPYVRYDGLYDATCVTDSRTWLSVTNTATGNDVRPKDVGGRITPVWGLHLIDVNLTLGNLVNVVGGQIKAR
ncbi:MAG: DUF3089 domain-containing protein [Actinomycetes bacterium]